MCMRVIGTNKQYVIYRMVHAWASAFCAAWFGLCDAPVDSLMSQNSDFLLPAILLLLLPPFQSIDHFDKSMYIVFSTHIDICYV